MYGNRRAIPAELGKTVITPDDHQNDYGRQPVFRALNPGPYPTPA